VFVLSTVRAPVSQQPANAASTTMKEKRSTRKQIETKEKKSNVVREYTQLGLENRPSELDVLRGTWLGVYQCSGDSKEVKGNVHGECFFTVMADLCCSIDPVSFPGTLFKPGYSAKNTTPRIMVYGKTPSAADIKKLPAHAVRTAVKYCPVHSTSEQKSGCKRFSKTGHGTVGFLGKAPQVCVSLAITSLDSGLQSLHLIAG
jgi:hypothetical protein